MAKILKFERTIFEEEPDEFMEILLKFQNDMYIALDKLAVNFIKDLEKIGSNEILKRKFELQYPRMCAYIKKRNAENWIT